MNKCKSITGLGFVLALMVAAPACAQFKPVPAAKCQKPKPSQVREAEAYGAEAARHLYGCFATKVYKGKLPPLLYGVMVVETEIDAAGKVKGVTVVRKPAAAEVEPWVKALIQRGAPYPAPARLAGGKVKFIETFLVDKSGSFQTRSLSEGQL
jgi:hypothetical protein